ncbi:hypothetical protein CBP14_13130 [Fischerella thermalis WC245]|nr:hypothetical protein CBP14_13130 [Fischerella thermalis WC245]
MIKNRGLGIGIPEGHGRQGGQGGQGGQGRIVNKSLANYPLPITHYQLPITHYQLPITKYATLV